MNGILKYPGAKHRIADWIIGHFPPHKAYLEPFCGSAAVFFAKEPARTETLNDINGDIVNLFRVLRDDRKAMALAAGIEMTPWAREEMTCSRARDESDDDVERARKYLVATWQSISGGQRYQTGWKHCVQSTGPVVTKAWRRLPDRLMAAAQRLKDAQIEQSDAIQLIEKFGQQSDTLIYIDPPYVISTRKMYLYKDEVDDDYHARLLDACLRAKAKVCISGYDCPLYRQKLNAWSKSTIRTRAEAAQVRTEVLWTNYVVLKQIEINMEGA